MRRARGEWIIERQLRGERVADIAKELGVSISTVEREAKRGRELGYVERVRERLLATLDAAPNVYAELLDPSRTAEELHKTSRGWKLKLDAANSLAEGLGAFKRVSEQNRRNTLELIAEEQGPLVGTHEIERPARVYFMPEPDDVVVDAMPEPPSDEIA